jgi:UDP:flavonoid glycosyltransferase YjiC (YdhE family)
MEQSIDRGLSQPSKPIIVACAFPAEGHTAGLVQISSFLVQRGYSVYFVGGTEFGNSIRNAGAEHIDVSRETTESRGIPPPPTGPGMGRIAWGVKYIFLDAAPTLYEAVRTCLENLRRKFPDRQVILLQDSLFCGLLPFFLGAPLPAGYQEFPKVINFHTTFNFMLSDDLPPFLSGEPVELPPSQVYKQRIKALNDSLVAEVEHVNQHAELLFKPLGTTRSLAGWLPSYVMDVGDITLLAYSPSMDFPRSDLSPKIRFIGGMPLKPISTTFTYPAFWSIIQANAALPLDSPGRKKVVFTTQGTVSTDFDKLMGPCIEALSPRDDLIVVGVLGRRGATVPAEFKLPSNTYIIDYLPYDALLPYTDVFVFNAGFGGFMHSVMNAVPMVVAGFAGDKAEVADRAGWCGLAIDLKTDAPSTEAIRSAVGSVLEEPSYKRRAIELRDENMRLNSLEAIENIIWEYADNKA